MTNHLKFTRRTIGKSALAGAALLGAPLPLRHAFAQAPANLKVALLLPTSGGQALIGQACRRGADVANDVFADMKIPAKLEIVNYDTETKPDVARTQAEKAIDAGANVLVGAFDSGQTIAIAQVAEQKGVPLIVNIAAAPPITESGLQVHRAQFPDGADAARRRLPAAEGDLQGLRHHAEDGSPAQPQRHLRHGDGRRHQGDCFPSSTCPTSCVDIITYDAAAKDLSVEVAKAKATKAELLLPICRLNDGKLIIQELVKQRWEPMIINPGAPGTLRAGFHQDRWASIATFSSPSSRGSTPNRR